MTEWFNKSPGGLISPSVDDPTMALVETGAPDWVRIPAEIGGGTVRVTGSFRAPCPMCSEGDEKLVLHMRTDVDLGVAECLEHGFVWYRRKAGE